MVRLRRLTAGVVKSAREAHGDWRERKLLLAALASAALCVFAAAAWTVGSVLTNTLHDSEREHAESDARLITDFGLASAFADGRLNRADLQRARRALVAIRAENPLIGVVVWNRFGEVVLRSGAGADAARKPPEIARQASAQGAPQTSYTGAATDAPAVAVAVPLPGTPQQMVAEFLFSRAGLVADLAAAKRRVYLISGVLALLSFGAFLPLLVRLTRRLPPPLDRGERALLAEFGRALKGDELCVHYQPKIGLAPRAVVGVEALVRWRHPRRGELPPSEFLPVVEQRDELLAQMTEQVIEHALRDCGRWIREGRRLPVAVNVGASVLLTEALVETVGEALERFDVDASLLTVEVTEGAMIEQGDLAICTLERLRELGVMVSIDDFGTGYSSLARLQHLPVDELKVDRGFVSEIATNDHDLAIARLIVGLGTSLELQVVAEGVEDERTLAVLVELGCPVVQGFVFAPPMAEPELCRWIDHRFSWSLKVFEILVGAFENGSAAAA